jgi:hypothetical protein
LFDYISIVVEDPIISVAKDSINRFNLPHVCACPKQGSGFITPFSELEVPYAGEAGILLHIFGKFMILK